MLPAKNSPAILARSLQKRYGELAAVAGLDLEIERGEIFGLVGPDGAGKSTTIRMLSTLSLPSSGEAKVLGLDVVKEAEEVKARIGHMSERFNLYPTLTVEENLDFFARLRNVPRDVAGKRKEELLSFCRLESFRRRRAEHLSGGMQKKLALACSLIHEPEVIFLDEPTTGVDPLSRRDFWRIISGFLKKGITILVSTPYLDEAERFSRVALMHQGKIVACKGPQDLKAELEGKVVAIRACPIREALAALKRVPFLGSPQLFGETIHVTVDDTEKRSPEVRSLLEAKEVTVEEVRPIAPSLEDVFVERLTASGEKPTRRIANNNSAGILAKGGNGGEIAIMVSNLTRRFGDFTAVDRVSFEIKRGEIFGLLGPNGSGKTTTIRMITGLLLSTSGSTWLMGCDMAKEAARAQSRMGYMSQKFSLFGDLTVEENINFYGGLYGLSSGLLEERKGWVLEMAGLRGKEKTMPRELSGGWKQRLALGCTIIHSPEVIFLDEPTAGVDPLSRRDFWELIQELSSRGTTIFVTTHYMDEAEHCHRLGLLYQGKLVALGSPAELKAGKARGELVEITSSDYVRAFELVSSDERFHQVNLFGSTIHVVVDEAVEASRQIERLLEAGGVTVMSNKRIPFTIEDVFISVVEEQQTPR